jgi:YHS domain-containing protein
VGFQRAGIMRFLWFLVLGVVLYWVIRELFGTRPRKSRPTEEGGEEMVRDPQCGVYLPKSSAISNRRAGEQLFFCSEECERKYLSTAKN